MTHQGAFVFDGVRAVVFDAYGTLFDVSTAARRSQEELGEHWQEFADTWRSKQLQYTWLRSLMRRHADFWRVTGDALDYALEATGIKDESLRERLLGLYERPNAYDDARPALETLRAKGIKAAILSNATPRMLAEATESSGLASLLDIILSVEETGVFKPSPTVYQLASDRLGLWPAEMVFVSSNGWDAFAARAFGYRVAWCNRARQPPERLPEIPDITIDSLAELPPLVRRG